MLQNMQDFMTMDKSMSRAVNKITNDTQWQTHNDEHYSVNTKPKEDGIDNIFTVLQRKEVTELKGCDYKNFIMRS